MNSTSDLILKYQEQNAEITKNNIRLNERISILENVIRELQQDNLQLRINAAVKQNMTKKGALNKKQRIITTKEKRKKSINSSNSNENGNSNDNDKQNEQLQEEYINTKKRACCSKPINYILPSTKCKLRKGDPFTFGNEQ